MVIVIAAVIVVLAVILVVFSISRHRTPQLTRRLRSTSFSRRRSDRLKQAAAADVATILQADRYPGSDTSPGQESEL